MPQDKFPFILLANAKARAVYDKLNYPDPLPELKLYECDYKVRNAFFSDVEFSHYVSFIGVDISATITFDNCRFKKSVSLKNVRASLNLGRSIHNPKSIIFENCVFEEGFSFDSRETIIENSISLYRCQFDGEVKIKGIHITNGFLHVKECKFNNEWVIRSARISGNILLDNNEINGELSIVNTTCDYLIGERNIANDLVSIHKGVFRRGIRIAGGSFKKKTTIYKSQCGSEGISINDSEFERLVRVVIGFQNEKVSLTNFYPYKPNIIDHSSMSCESLYISSANFKGGIDVLGTIETNARIGTIELTASPELKGNIRLSHLSVNKISISGYNSAANIILEDLEIGELHIDRFNNSAGFILSDIGPQEWNKKNLISIVNTNFGKAQFSKIDFRKYFIKFSNNILIDVTVSMVNWFQIHQLQAWSSVRHDDDKDQQINSFSILQDLYRQLKLASQKQGNTPQALDFQRHEMNYYRKLIKLRKPRNWNEHFILWTSQTNNFGQNWIKPLLLLIVFSYFNYIPIALLTTDQVDYHTAAQSIPEVTVTLKVLFLENLRGWFIILNPAHRIKDISEKIDDFPIAIYFWDMLSRVIVSYFLFQTISAFRKFNK